MSDKDTNTTNSQETFEGKEDEQAAPIGNVAEPLSQGPHAPPSYPPPLVFGINLFALCISVFLVALDNTVISTAIPKITDQFHALQDVGWYGSGE